MGPEDVDDLARLVDPCRQSDAGFRREKTWELIGPIPDDGDPKGLQTLPRGLKVEDRFGACANDDHWIGRQLCKVGRLVVWRVPMNTADASRGEHVDPGEA